MFPECLGIVAQMCPFVKGYFLSVPVGQGYFLSRLADELGL